MTTAEYHGVVGNTPSCRGNNNFGVKGLCKESKIPEPEPLSGNACEHSLLEAEQAALATACIPEPSDPQHGGGWRGNDPHHQSYCCSRHAIRGGDRSPSCLRRHPAASWHIRGMVHWQRSIVETRPAAGYHAQGGQKQQVRRQWYSRRQKPIASWQTQGEESQLACSPTRWPAPSQQALAMGPAARCLGKVCLAFAPLTG